MKINLITQHSGESYGAVLQTYATSKILQSLEHEVTIINLVRKSRIKNYFSIKKLNSYPKYINFWHFKNKYYPPRTKLMKEIDLKKLPQADYTIVGSDQVWNSDITKENKISFFLNFVKTSRRLSLASSFGRCTWNEDEKYTEKVKECLSKFSAISVREESGIEICRDVFGVDATCIIDPTIAWGKYDEFIVKKSLEQIACFSLKPNNPIVVEVLDTLTKKTKLPVTMLDYYSGNKYNKLKTKEKSPIRWMNEIYNSNYVVTDSFHGVAFSILFKKQFFAICADTAKFTRISSLLKKVGLENRVLKSANDLEENWGNLLKPIDYSTIEPILKEEQKKYYKFVTTNII